MYEYKVKEILRVVDGDTIDARISLGFGLEANFRFRVYGVDTPEIYGRNAVPEGRIAAEFTWNWLVGRSLIVKTFRPSNETIGIGDGAFGRWMASFIDENGESLADALIVAGLVKNE